MKDRDYTLKRLMSRTMTPEEFKYESLYAPPLYSMLSPQDIATLNYYATSPLYSAKLKEKYKLIDDLMISRGFKKLFAGTNRVAYEPLFANNFIIKVAYDKVALQDSINEFYNQHLLKPFCCKVFEVSPCGTVGVFEKVQPITNSDEFLSVAADVFVLLNNFLSGEYVMDDIGTHYINNYGVRIGFGPVILDFPYVYRIDPKKIFCNKPDSNNPSGYCNGPIDYDVGFNKLYCQKCGCIYKPFELAKKMEYNKLINYEREESKMKIKISGGDHNLKKQVLDLNDMQRPVSSIKTNKKFNNKPVSEHVEEPIKEKKTVNGMAPAEDGIIDTTPVEEIKAPVVQEEIDMSKDEKEVISVVSFDDNIKGKSEDPGYDEDNDVEKLLIKINNIYNYDEKSDEEKEEIVNIICTLIESILSEHPKYALKLLATILRKNKENIEDDLIKEFLDNIPSTITDKFIDNLIDTDNIIIETEETDEDYESTDEDDDYEDASGLDLANAEIVSKKDIFANEKPEKVLVIKNDNGTYLEIEGKIIAVDHISGRKLDDITIVPKDYYEKLSAIADGDGSAEEEEE